MPPKYIRYGGKSSGKSNEEVKALVYSCILDDDDFYAAMKPLEKEARNKFIGQRLREIENKRWRAANPELAQTTDQVGCLIGIGFVIFILVILFSS